MREESGVLRNLLTELQLTQGPEEFQALKERVTSLEEILLSYQKEGAGKSPEPKRRTLRSWTEFRARIEAPVPESELNHAT